MVAYARISLDQETTILATYPRPKVLDRIVDTSSNDGRGDTQGVQVTSRLVRWLCDPRRGLLSKLAEFGISVVPSASEGRFLVAHT
jgi:hypothetical protein